MISCTIIVANANELTGTIHNHMPVVPDNADVGAWLKSMGGTELLRSAAEGRLRIWGGIETGQQDGTGR
jgi:putative SOS response-associated peptidase YedK